jgi:hypothetical protein
MMANPLCIAPFTTEDYNYKSIITGRTLLTHFVKPTNCQLCGRDRILVCVRVGAKVNHSSSFTSLLGCYYLLDVLQESICVRDYIGSSIAKLSNVKQIKYRMISDNGG